MVSSEVPNREEKCRPGGFICVLSSCWCLRHLCRNLPRSTEKVMPVKKEGHLAQRMVASDHCAMLLPQAKLPGGGQFATGAQCWLSCVPCEAF